VRPTALARASEVRKILGASRLFVFKGQAAALQYAVNPNWRGITPYVALFPQAGDVKLVLGNPSAQDFEGWLTAGKK
jgi:hypothetical protein